MSRIDEALRRATQKAEAADDEATIVSVPARSHDAEGEPFQSPWTFDTDEVPPGTELSRPAAHFTAERQAGPLPVRHHGLLGNLGSEILERLAVGPKAHPLVREQFRRLAATLHHSQVVQGTKVLMVTSAMPGDGKSLTATNIALTLSESYGREVLLVDGDLRRPTLHTLFQVENVTGLNEGLKAGSDAKLSVVGVTSTLTLLPAGKPNPDPMSQLTSARLDRIVREAATRFDWVILDTAPVGLLADASLIAAIVDGAIVVVGAGTTPHPMVEKAIEIIGRERVLGVVLNRADQDLLNSDAAYYVADTPGQEPERT